MSFSNFFKKYQLILILSFIVVIMTIIKVTYKPDYNQVQEKVSSNITSIPTEIPQFIPTEASTSPIPTKTNIKAATNSGQKDLLAIEKLLPYRGKNFIVQYLKQPNILAIDVVVTDLNNLSALKTVESDVKKFLTKNKFDPENYKLEWNFDYQPN